MDDMSRLTKAVAVLALLSIACTSGETGNEGDDYAAEMAEQHQDDRPVAAAAASGAPADSVEGRETVYATVGGREIDGYLATPVGTADSLPGVIVIHEWWGVNENIRTMARKLAARGYAALAVDLYGDRVASTSDSAMKLVRSVDEAAARSNLRQAYGFLIERGAPAVASLGWCFGGGWSLRTALELPEKLDAAVIYYGQLVTEPDRLSRLTMPVLGHFGDQDNSIPLEDVRAFRDALSRAGVTHEIRVYEGAGHAFANPSGERYVEAAADTAWRRTLHFLDEHLKGDSGSGGEGG